MFSEFAQNSFLKPKGRQEVSYSKSEELINIITSILGIVFGALGGALLIIASVYRGLGALAIVAVSLYAFSIICMYLFSTLYHAQPAGTLRRMVLRRFDHCSIPICIAGTYAPLMLIGLNNTLGITMASLILGLALIVICFNIINLEKFKHLCVIAYVIMGWLGVVVMVPLFKAGFLGTNILLLVGGAVFTLGIFFYKQKHLKYNHAIWHFFFMAGHVLHYWCIMWLVMTA